MGEELTELQKALGEVRAAVDGLSADSSLAKQDAPAAAPVGAPSDDRRIRPDEARSDVEAAGLTKAVENLSAQSATMSKALTTLLEKQAEEDEEKKEKAELAKARLARVRKVRGARVAKQAKEVEDEKLEKMITRIVAKALGVEVDEDEKVKKQKSPYPKPEEEVKKQKEEEDAELIEKVRKMIGPHAEEKGEGDELSRADTKLMSKAYDEEELDKQLTRAEEELEKQPPTEEEEDVEKALAAALTAQDEEEEVEKQVEEEIPEELKKLLASRGFALSGDYNPKNQLEKARLLKKMGYKPMPVTQGLPFEPRSVGAGDGTTLGDVVDKMKGMNWDQLNQLRTKMGAW